MRIALLSCTDAHDPDVDERPLTDALQRLGVEAQSVPWNAPGAAWQAFDAAVVRSTWDYHLKVDAFRAFVHDVTRHTRLINPPAIIEATLHKGYLLRLESLGIPVVPTTLVPRDAPLPTLPDGPIVVKPAIGGGSWQTQRFDHAVAAEAFLTRSVDARDTLVQPALPGFEDPGERCFVWIDGRITHGIRKRPRFEGTDEHVDPVTDLTQADQALAHAALATLPAIPLFARVDVVDHEGRPVVTELETIEPSLYLDSAPGTADRLAAAIVRSVRG